MHGGPQDLPADEDELLHARRLVAQRCLYGVDKNPMAIDLARLSLWLVTLARDHEFTFIDHALRHGDSLVGLTRNQIERFHWAAEAPSFQLGTETMEVRRHVERISEMRQLIRELGDEASENELRQLLDKAESELRNVRRVADLILAAFFEGEKPKERESNRLRYAELLLKKGQAATELPVLPFHWELEFPEVFERENPGFDAVIGNPPFAGHVTVVKANVSGYTDWLRKIHPESTGKCDLVAHFFRRVFSLLRNSAALGLIATNTIGQGDTRSSGLRWICKHGGHIYRAQRRLKWPGKAAVVVSVIHATKGPYTGPNNLDGQDVETISAFLFHSGGHDDPEMLEANSQKSFVGSYVLGMGFTFDDNDTKSIVTPLSEMHQLIDANPRNQEVIFPYIGGEEVNTSPNHSHHRYIINFRDWPLHRSDLGETWRDANDDKRRDWLRDEVVPIDYPEPVAADFPELLAIIAEKVKPERLQSSERSKSSHGRRARIWWQFYHQAKELNSAIDGLNRVLVISEVGQHCALAFLPSRMIYSHTLKIFSFDSYSAFCALQSRPHEIWARFFGSSLEDRLRYTPSDCFETFPFPEGWETHPSLEATGKEYYEFRAELMVKNNEGLTKTYNRLHDPDERSQEITTLRELHEKMDRAVLDAYGWSDILTGCEFLLDYEIDEETWGRKKKPWRYRWPDSVRDEVLARLLALNAERAQDERLVNSHRPIAAQPKGTLL